MVEFEDGKVAPSAREWVAMGMLHPSYSDAEPFFLYFLDKYATIMVGGLKGMARWYKNNKGMTLLDKLTVSDITFSMLMYENAYDVWMKEVLKATASSTEKRVALNKSTTFNAELGLHCIMMDGQVMDACTSAKLVRRFRL